MLTCSWIRSISALERSCPGSSERISWAANTRVHILLRFHCALSSWQPPLLYCHPLIHPPVLLMKRVPERRVVVHKVDMAYLVMETLKATSWKHQPTPLTRKPAHCLQNHLQTRVKPCKPSSLLGSRTHPPSHASVSTSTGCFPHPLEQLPWPWSPKPRVVGLEPAVTEAMGGVDLLSVSHQFLTWGRRSPATHSSSAEGSSEAGQGDVVKRLLNWTDQWWVY